MININIQPLIVNLSMEEEIEYLMCEVSEFIEALETGSNAEAINESDDKDLNREINNSMSESDDEDDVVDISDDLVENMMGLPKKGE